MILYSDYNSKKEFQQFDYPLGVILCYCGIFPLFFPYLRLKRAMGRYNTREIIRQSKTSANLAFTRVCG